MRLDFRTPGVYVRDVEVVPRPVLRMGVTGFVGQAERGPLNYPQPLASWQQFLSIFGGFAGFSYLSYAVFGFFLNGGERCYVVRVAHETARRASLDLVDMKNQTTMAIVAANEGQWANTVTLSVDARSTDDLTLTELAGDLGQSGQIVTFKSVSGLVGDDLAGVNQGDVVTLVDRQDPSSRETLPIVALDFATKTVIFGRPVAKAFPAGSAVVGRGFRITVREGPTGVLPAPAPPAARGLLRRPPRVEIFDNLSLDLSHSRYFVRVINGQPEERDLVRAGRQGQSMLIRVADPSQGAVLPNARPATVAARPLAGGDAGPLNLDYRYYTGRDKELYVRPAAPGAGESERREIADRLYGLAAFEAVNEIGAIAIPDAIVSDLQARPIDPSRRSSVIFTDRVPVADPINLKRAQDEMLAHCERMGDRFAILDAPPGARLAKDAAPVGSPPELVPTVAAPIEDWPGNFHPHPNAKYGALYYPWIRESPTDFDGLNLLIPPSGHVAGIYARAENERGVAKAPANETVKGAVQLEVPLSDADQSLLNPRGVNCLRAFPGRGVKVWGARTLSTDPISRYVNVRRLTLAIIKQITVNLQWSVFEPNDQRLRDKIVSVLTLFFRDLLRTGALAGATPEEAFFVACNDETNSPEVVDRGELITRIGFAPANPAEFILVTVRRTAESVAASETA